MNNNNPQQILELIGQNHKFEVEFIMYSNSTTLNPQSPTRNTNSSHNQRPNKALIPFEGFLKPLNQDLILIIAYESRTKSKTR